jgi:hypothetical protein
MERRTFLRMTAIGSSGAVLGCGAAAPRLTDRQEDELALRLELGLGTIRNEPQGSFAREMPEHARPQLSERILRLGLEALVVVDVTRSIPHGASVGPALAQRLSPEAPIVDRYASTYRSLLAGMPNGARTRVASKLRANPDLPMRVAGWLDQHGRRIGVAPEGRGSLRAIASQLGTRMRRQSASAVIDDCVAKVDRAMARGGYDAANLRSARANAMIAAIWQSVDGEVGTQLGAPTEYSSAPSAQIEDAEWESVVAGTNAGLWSARWSRPGDEEQEIGAIMMPFGAATCGLLLIVGFFIWIAGTVQNASWDGTPRSEQ